MTIRFLNFSEMNKMEERLDRIEASLAELHSKIDLLVGHERWVNSIRRLEE